MAVSSYLPDVAGGMVVGAAFDGDDAARAAIELLRSSGVRRQDVSVITSDERRAEAIAGDEAWTPARNAPRFAPLRRMLPGGGLPREVRRRYGADLRAGRAVLLVAADGQPPDTIAALLAQANGSRIEQWWQGPAAIFAPPELAGPF